MVSTSECVVDASAILAFVFRERGIDTVETWLERGAAASASTIQETVSKLVQKGASVDEAEEVVMALGLDIHALVTELAMAAGAMFPVTGAYGLSHGDRACLALSAHLGLPVITVDANWSNVASVLKVDVQQFR